MNIDQIAKRIIKAIKTWPVETRQSQDVGGPKTSWDEYKEQIQFEEYDSFEETIESMVKDEVIQLSEKVIEKLFRSIHKRDYPTTAQEREEEVIKSILLQVKSEAESQDIEYRKPDIKYIRYYDADLAIIAEVLAQVSPEEYLIQGYSEATGSGGEQGVANLSVLEDENGLERITAEEFEGKRYSFFNNNLSQQLNIEF
jgi:hypothetical protein